jgi:hypothetical protein
MARARAHARDEPLQRSALVVTVEESHR